MALNPADEAELRRLRAENHGLRAELDEAELRFELVLEATKDGVWSWDFATNETT